MKWSIAYPRIIRKWLKRCVDSAQIKPSVIMTASKKETNLRSRHWTITNRVFQSLTYKNRTSLDLINRRNFSAKCPEPITFWHLNSLRLLRLKSLRNSRNTRGCNSITMILLTWKITERSTLGLSISNMRVISMWRTYARCLPLSLPA